MPGITAHTSAGNEKESGLGTDSTSELGPAGLRWGAGPPASAYRKRPPTPDAPRERSVRRLGFGRDGASVDGRGAQTAG
eukprot:2185148-Prymnesium_polylepis.2